MVCWGNISTPGYHSLAQGPPVRRRLSRLWLRGGGRLQLWARTVAADSLGLSRHQVVDDAVLGDHELDPFMTNHQHPLRLVEYVSHMTNPVELPGYTFLGWGPRATSPGSGWHLASDLFARCARCGGVLRLWDDQSEQCPCGRLYKDGEAGRFGSSDGDASIAIYRRLS